MNEINEFQRIKKQKDSFRTQFIYLYVETYKRTNKVFHEMGETYYKAHEEFSQQFIASHKNITENKKSEPWHWLEEEDYNSENLSSDDETDFIVLDSGEYLYYKTPPHLQLLNIEYTQKSEDRDWGYICLYVANQLTRRILDLNPQECINLLSVFYAEKGELHLPGYLGNLYFLDSVKQCVKKYGLSQEIKDWLVRYKQEDWHGSWSSKKSKLESKISEILSFDVGEESRLLKAKLDDDIFGTQINQYLASLKEPLLSIHCDLFHVFKQVSGSKPNGKFLKSVQNLINEIGTDPYRSFCKQWLDILRGIDLQEIIRNTEYEGREFSYSEYQYLTEGNQTFIKGWVWSTLNVFDDEILSSLAQYAEKCYRKIPQKGPMAPGVGNACLYVLSQTGLTGISHLSRLRLRIRQSNTQNLIAAYIQAYAEQTGVSATEIEDMAVPDFGLSQGQAEFVFDAYLARLRIQSVSKVDVQWQKADGTLLKAKPSALTKTHSTALKQLKETQTQVQKTLSAQRDRLDRDFIRQRSLSFEWFSQYYWKHPLMGWLTQRLIWTFISADSQIDAFWLDGQWRDVHENVVMGIEESTSVQLWHPIHHQPETILAWRNLLLKHQIQQPLKQAFREVYLLTDAEVRTNTYSNRMAAHILKQHQMNSLAKVRGWAYSLIGCYDGIYEGNATLSLPQHQLKAEFWISALSDLHADDNDINDVGIYLYISTDQVRFYRDGSADPMPLIDVPPLIFSEVMRDVDLFVGVASVGNDPNWADQGDRQHRNYWHDYSFGALSEISKTRKQVLEKLLPRLKIASVCEIGERFLQVKGQHRTYKIHLGSGNILMEPNDQYLCIVPDQRAAAKKSDPIFLPFDGDNTLSLILSKAFLLAEDHKITDPTILSQIHYH